MSCLTLVTPRTIARQAPLSVGFPRGSSPPGMEPASSALQADSLLTEPLGRLS